MQTSYNLPLQSEGFFIIERIVSCSFTSASNSFDTPTVFRTISFILPPLSFLEVILTFDFAPSSVNNLHFLKLSCRSSFQIKDCVPNKKHRTLPDAYTLISELYPSRGIDVRMLKFCRVVNNLQCELLNRSDPSGAVSVNVCNAYCLSYMHHCSSKKAPPSQMCGPLNPLIMLNVWASGGNETANMIKNMRCTF